MIAIAAIAQGNLLLLAIGLAVSIPLIVAGAALIMALLEPLSDPDLGRRRAARLDCRRPYCRRSRCCRDTVASALADSSPSNSNSPPPATGAVLAIVIGGLWRCWHEGNAGASAANKRRLSFEALSWSPKLTRRTALFHCASMSSLRYLQYQYLSVGFRFPSAMVAPYFCGLLIGQSDFGHPAGAVLPMLTTQSLRTFPQNLACGARRRICMPRLWRACKGCVGVFADIWNDLGDRRCRRAPSSGSIRPRATGSSSRRAGDKDVFVHISAVERAGLRSLNEGQEVEFELVTNRGRTSAENLKVA